MLAALSLLEASVEPLFATDPWSLSTAEIGEFCDRVATVEARLAAAKLAVIAEADGRDIGVAAATSTAGWARQRLRLHPGTAGRAVKLAKALHCDCAATGAALASGAVNAEQAWVITRVMTQLPPVDGEVRAAVEQFLIAQTAVLDPVELGRAGQHLIERLTSEPDADGRVLRQQERRCLHLFDAYDGMTGLRGMLDAESAALVKAALDPLAAPRPAQDGVPDPRSAGQRYADGLADLSRIALASGDLPTTGGPAPTMTVAIDLDSLTGQLTKAGLLGDGAALPAVAARRVACDARVIPVILDGPSQPLDVGRSRRTIPPAIRTALQVRDQGCAFPGCQRPGNWSEGHHIRHWADGGNTALGNLVLLCLAHHRAVHEHGWHVALDHDGLPYFTPPPWIDPDGTRRQHHRYRLRRLPFDTGGRSPPEQ